MTTIAWRRGITRVYIVAWVVWAFALLGPTIFGLRYGPREREVKVLVPASEVTSVDAFFSSPRAGRSDSVEVTRLVPYGPPRLHNPNVNASGAILAFLLAIPLPALILWCGNWIIAGFLGARRAP